MNTFPRPLTGLFTVFAIASLTACGGGGGSGSSATAETGEVAVLITDGPTDEYERMLVTMRRMLLLGGGNGQRVLYDGEPVTFDLLQLRDRADLAFTADILADTYSKIRIELDEVRLIDLGDPADSGDDVEVVLEDLPANGKIDINPRGPFTVEAGRTTIIQLDMDANRSVQVVETGNDRLKLRPIIFGDIYTGDVILPSRLVRVFGEVDSLDETPGMESIVLCDLSFVSQLGGPSTADPADCVRAFFADASVFDTDGQSSDFATLAQTFANLGPGDEPIELTAVGLPSVPGAGAPPSVVLDLDAVVGTSGPRKTDTEPGWETTSGIVVSDPAACDADQCADFLPNDEAVPISARLQPETRVFRRDGTELAQSDIANTDSATVDGLRADSGGSDELRASLFVLGPPVGEELVVGTLTGVGSNGDFDILTVIPDGGAPVAVCVGNETDVVRVIVDDDAVTIADLLDPTVLDPSADLQVEAAGDASAEADCDVEARVVVIE